jgi:hypothetical protein
LLLLSSKNSDQFPLYKDLEAHFTKVIGESSNSNAEHIHMIPYASGWWCNSHLEKYESQWEA